MRFNNNMLTPEQQKAFRILQNCVAGSNVVPKLIVPQKTMFQTDFVACTDSFHFLKRGNLPTEAGWSWNQSNAKQIVSLDENRTVTIQKMNPRRKRHVTSSPSYKIWIMTVSQQGKRDIEYIWCEKGLPAFTKQVSYSITTKFTLPKVELVPQDLNLDDFAFLYEYTDLTTALELGWI